MKVCHFTSAHKSDDIRIFHKECVSLAEAGYDVYLIAANTEEKVIDGVSIINVDKPTSGRFSRMLKTSKAVYKKAISIDADVYHFHDPELLRFALRLKRKGKKVIYDAHEDVPKQILGKYWINKYLRKTVALVFRLFENFISKRLDCVITATPHIRDRFLKVNKNTVDVNNFPLMKELLVPSDWSLKKNEVCYVGGITQIRGLHFVVESFLYLENIKLNLVGSFSHNTNEFENGMKALLSWEKVNFYGQVSRKEVGDIFSNSKAGLVTFLPLPNHMDSQPNKIFEYMSAGIPVVASDFPLWKEIIEVGNCGICIDPEQPTKIAEAIQKIIDNPNMAQEMGANGRKLVIERYNWDIEKLKLLEIYSRLSF